MLGKSIERSSLNAGGTFGVGQGTVDEGRHQFSWRSESTSWERATLRQATVVVTYKVQGKEYEVRAATILDSAQVLQ
jgi:hypothetical protein